MQRRRAIFIFRNVARMENFQSRQFLTTILILRTKRSRHQLMPRAILFILPVIVRVEQVEPIFMSVKNLPRENGVSRQTRVRKLTLYRMKIFRIFLLMVKHFISAVRAIPVWAVTIFLKLI